MRYFDRVGIGTLSLLLTLTACDHLLDVQPEEAVDAEVAIETAADVENALSGAFNRVQLNTVYGSRHNIISELLAHSDEVVFSGTFDGLQSIYNKDQSPSNEFATRMWLDAYQGINAANVVLAHMELIEDAAQHDRVRGEALFVRGITYHFLARFFAPPWNAGDPDALLGVAIELEPTEDATEDIFRPRSSLSESYARILEDLESAATLLPEAPDQAGRPTTYAASAFLSQVYLAQGRYVEAAEAASRVIEQGPHTLVGSYANAFNNPDDSPEDVFAIQQTSLQSAGDNRSFYTSLAPSEGRGDIDITQQHLDLYEDGDDRLDLFYEGTGTKPGIPRSGKWRELFISIPIIRLAELYLTRAEANLRTGAAVGPNSPAEDVNVIRERVSLPPLATVELADILRERHLELAWEGHALPDLKRTEGSVTHLGTTYEFDHPKLVLPIPQREIDINPELQQNPGY